MFSVVYFVWNTEKTARFYQKAFGARRMKPPAAQDYPPEGKPALHSDRERRYRLIFETAEAEARSPRSSAPAVEAPARRERCSAHSR